MQNLYSKDSKYITDRNEKDDKVRDLFEKYSKPKIFTRRVCTPILDHYSVEELNLQLSKLPTTFPLIDGLCNIISNYLSLLPRFFFAVKHLYKNLITNPHPSMQDVQSDMTYWSEFPYGFFIVIDSIDRDMDEFINDYFQFIRTNSYKLNPLIHSDFKKDLVQTTIIPLSELSIPERIVKVKYLVEQGDKDKLDEAKKIVRELRVEFRLIVENEEFYPLQICMASSPGPEDFTH